MKKYLLLLLLPLLFIHFTKPNRSKPRKGKDYALLFAVEDYTDKRLGQLKYPISNATDLKNELEFLYNFDCKLVKNPTADSIESELKAYAQKFETDRQAQEGQFFIFFSGHGERDKASDVGYFLARTTDIKKLSTTAFSYETGRKLINKMACQHIFVAIDACKSGSFAESDRSGDVLGRPNELSATAKFMIETERRKTRLFLTSGSMDANTPDKSNFVEQILSALITKGNMKTGKQDHILTMGELYSFVETASPIPTFGKFGDNKPGSNFCFVAKEGENYMQDADSNTTVTAEDSETGDAFFVRVYNGSFWMGSDGSDSQKPKHEVKLNNFFISPYEVTFEAYDTYCEAKKDAGIPKPKDAGFGRGKRPVINVNWLDAVKYCNWLSEREGYKPAYKVDGNTAERISYSKGYRLPTEAEWEYAATLNNKNSTFSYSGGNNADIVAVTNENSGLKTAIVGSKKPNSLGLYDMSGNVAEWTDDCWEKNYNNAKSDGAACKSGDCDARVVRGGSFLLVNRFATNYARIKKGLSTRSNECGFRVVRSQ